MCCTGCRIQSNYGELFNSKKWASPKARPFRSAETVAVRLLLRCSRLCRRVRVLLRETLDAPCCIDQLLLTGEKRVAVRANFDLQHVALDGRPRRELIAARAVHGDGVVVGMNAGFHDGAPVCRVRSARRDESYSRVARSRDKLRLYDRLMGFQNLVSGRVLIDLAGEDGSLMLRS